MAVMREEIFGPLLPIETYRDARRRDRAASTRGRIRSRSTTSARERARSGKVLRETLAGGVTVNDTLWHFAHKNLPFGGVGASGVGAYHGEASFLTFTHREAGVRAAAPRGGEAPVSAVRRKRSRRCSRCCARLNGR